MNTAVPAPKPRNRIPKPDPFELGQELEGTRKQIPDAGPAYGCVEWFQYLDHRATTPAFPATAPGKGCARRL